MNKRPSIFKNNKHDVSKTMASSGNKSFLTIGSKTN